MSKTLKYPEFKSTDSFSKLFCRKFLVEYCVKNQRFSLDEEFNKKNAPYLSFLCGNMIGVGAEQENLYHYLHYLYKYSDDEKIGHYLAFKASYSTCSALFRKEILEHLVELYQEVRETIEKEEEIKVPKYPMADLLKEYGVSIKSLREIHYILSDKSDEELLEGDFPRNDDYFQWKGMYPLNYFVKADFKRDETKEHSSKEYMEWVNSLNKESNDEEDRFLRLPDMSKLISEKFGIDLSEEEVEDIARKNGMVGNSEYCHRIIHEKDKICILELRGMYAAMAIAHFYLKDNGLLPKESMLLSEFPEYCRNLKLNQQ